MSNKIAQIRNISLCWQAMERALEAPMGSPRFVCFFGLAGYGKTTAAAYVAARTNAQHVECKSTWPPKTLLIKIAEAYGLRLVKGTVADIQDRVISRMIETGYPLILDECGHILKRENMIEIVRDLHDSTQLPIMLIGEDYLPEKISAYERVHSRVLEWVQAQPLSYEDALNIRNTYCEEGLFVEDELVKRFAAECKGQVRRVVVNINDARNWAARNARNRISAKDWQGRQLNLGKFERSYTGGRAA